MRSNQNHPPPCPTPPHCFTPCIASRSPAGAFVVLCSHNASFSRGEISSHSMRAFTHSRTHSPIERTLPCIGVRACVCMRARACSRFLKSPLWRSLLFLSRSLSRSLTRPSSVPWKCRPRQSALANRLPSCASLALLPFCLASRPSASSLLLLQLPHSNAFLFERIR